MTSRVSSQCLSCEHFKSPLDTGKDQPTCAAFPDGIPDEIWWNRADHRKSYPGDHGIRWAPDGDVQFPDYAMQEA